MREYIYFRSIFVYYVRIDRGSEIYSRFVDSWDIVSDRLGKIYSENEEYNDLYDKIKLLYASLNDIIDYDCTDIFDCLSVAEYTTIKEQHFDRIDKACYEAKALIDQYILTNTNSPFRLHRLREDITFNLRDLVNEEISGLIDLYKMDGIDDVSIDASVDVAVFQIQDPEKCIE